MGEVTISREGVIKNILSLNYDHETTIREYLNNILDKNTHPEHSVHFNMKEINTHFMFECYEMNAIGFQNLDEITRAFKIADSERCGTNNMGYGIFSPITINSDHDAYGLFIQTNENGSYYSVVYFNHKYSKIWTQTGEIGDECISLDDVSYMNIHGGTRFVWITHHPNVDQDESGSNISLSYIINKIKNNYIKSLKYDNLDSDRNDIINIGAYYSEYLQHPTNPRSIFYGSEKIEAINFLHNDRDEKTIPQIHELAIAKDSESIEHQVKNEEGVWKTLVSTGVGKKDARIRSLRNTTIHTAYLKVYDIGIPSENISTDAKNKRRSFRKIWVKLNDTYIFSEEFPMNGWPNCRVVFELTNSGDNNFNWFISPDPNKSNSSINQKLKLKLVALIKKTLNTHFSCKVTEEISLTLKHDVWENECDRTRHICTNEDCSNEMTVWNYDVTRIDPSEGNELWNLLPICKKCKCNRE